MLVTRQGLAGVIDAIQRCKQRGLDSETTGLLEDDELFSLIIATDDDVYYFNFNPNAMVADLVLDRVETFRSLSVLFMDPEAEWFIHNAKFDMRMVRKEGCEIAGKVYCSYAIERVLKNNIMDGKEPYGLDACLKRRGLAKSDAVKQYIEKNGLFSKKTMPGKKKIIKDLHFEQVPFEVMAPYGESDGRQHLWLGREQMKDFQRIEEEDAKLEPLQRPPSIRDVLKNEIRLTKTLFRMERAGVLLDKSFVAKALEYEIGEINRAKSEFQASTGSEFVDSNKPLQLVFDKLGEKYPLTAKGNPSFAADVLEDMTSPVAAMVNKIRHHEKRAGTYYSSFLYFMDKNNVIHADARQAGTEPGRMSYRDPNLQNVPKEDDPEDQAIPYHIRESFIPRPGHFYYSVDYKQMEYRMMMDYAGEMRIIKRILDGEDFHDAIASEVNITRKQAKTLNFALSYGAGPAKIAKMLGITKAEAYELRATYFGRLPRLEKLFKDVQASGGARGYIFNWYGRRCHIAQRDWNYILPNHLIQGGCADVVKIAMNRIDDYLLEKNSPTKMLLQVHDELLIECPFGDERVIEPIVKFMETVYKPRNGMILHTSVEHSLKSWGYRDKIKGTPFKQSA